jgi:alanine racemase
MSRPIVCEISIAALQHNLRRVRECASGQKVWAVIKANAYGHGTAAAVQGFAHADGLAMLDFDDAVLCRQLGWRKPILMLEGAFSPADIGQAEQHSLELVVHSEHQLQWFEKSQAQLHLHIKLNTGMNRLGFAPSLYREIATRVEATNRALSVTAVTHFANSDWVDNEVQTQSSIVKPAAQIESFGLHQQRVSIANSAALIRSLSPLPLPAGQPPALWVRPGIMLYGSSPLTDQTAIDLDLRAAMSLRSEIIAVQSLAAGDQVGYGSCFTATKPMLIGIVACGYADGYPRVAPSNTPIAVEGIQTGTVGRVSMDMLAVDLTNLKFPANGWIGASVELWGAKISVDSVASSAGTIGYELLCAVAPRVRRKLLTSP